MPPFFQKIHPVLRKRISVLLGLVVLVVGAFIASNFSGISNAALVICTSTINKCEAKSAADNLSISATPGVLTTDGQATTLRWHAVNVENTVVGANCFGKDEISPCGTPYQILDPGDISMSKHANYFTVDSDTYLSIAENGDSSVLYKWMGPTQPYSESSPLPMNTAGGIKDTTMFDRSFSLDPGETVKSVVVYVTTPPPNNFLGIKIGQRSKTANSWTVVAEQGCTITERYTWYECVFTSPYTVPSNDTATYTYHVGSYVNANGGPLGAGGTAVLASYKTSNQTPANGTQVNKYTEGTFDTNFMRVVYNKNTNTGTPCFGNGTACDLIFQKFSTGASNAQNRMQTVVINDVPYLIIAQHGATSKVYKWLGSCFGSGSTCGSAFQDLGSVSSKALGGIKPFAIGTDTYAALGSWGADSGIYKWMGSCFGDGTTCGALYQTVGGSNAQGGWEPFKYGTDTYLASANNNTSSELYKWMPPATTLGTQGGLTGEYFNNTTLSGTPALTRQEAVNFNWSTASPGSGVNADGFSVRWSGTVVAPITGPYVFYMGSDDGERLYVNGNLMTSEWSNHAFNTKTSATVNLTAGQQVPIVAEYYESTNTARVELSWSYTGQAKTIIPASALYSGYTHPACAGDGTYCGVPMQTVGALADSSTNGGWHSFKMGTETFLGFATGAGRSRLFKFKTATEPFEASDFSDINKTGDAGNTIFDKSWSVDPNRTVDKISVWSTTYQTNAYVKLAKRTGGGAGTGTYSILLSTQCTLQPYVWTDCDIPNQTTDGGEWYAGAYSPTALGQTGINVPRAKAASSNASGNVTLAEDSNNAISVRVIYAEAAAPITPCLGDGYSCGQSYQDFTSSNEGTYGWDSKKVGTETYLVLGQKINASPVYRWMDTFKCFGNGSTCGTSTQNLDGGGDSITPIGASFKFIALGGKAYLASAGYNVETKIYKGTELSAASIMVNPSLSASTTDVSWAAVNVTSCTVSGTGLSWSGTGSYFATTTRRTTAPALGTYTIDCIVPSGVHIIRYANAYVQSNFWLANDVEYDGTWPTVWPMNHGGECRTDGSCYLKNNDFVSKWGATALFGAHARSMGVGTIVGQFTGHGPTASQGGGWEWTHADPDSKRQFPNPPLKTKPEYYTPVVVNSGGVVDLEWTCMDQQDQLVPNTCPDPTGWTCNDYVTKKPVNYSDSTVGTGFSTGGALYGRKSVTVTADTTFKVQCISHPYGNTPVFPEMSIPVYITGSPNIPLPPSYIPPKTTGCAVRATDVNGTTDIATGNDSPTNGTTVYPEYNTTYTLSCSMEDGTTEEASIRVLIPPKVSVSTTNAAEPSTDGSFVLSIDDAIDEDITVNYTRSGTASSGSDYASIPSSGTAVIRAGYSSVTIPVDVIDDYINEADNETVILTVQAGTGYLLGTPSSGTVTITDNENDSTLPSGVQGDLTSCTGVASATCNLAANPIAVRSGGTTVISWYVDRIMTSGGVVGGVTYAGDACNITASPTPAGWSNPSISSANTSSLWQGSQSATITTKTKFTLECTAPSGAKESTSINVTVIPTYQEI